MIKDSRYITQLFFALYLTKVTKAYVGDDSRDSFRKKMTPIVKEAFITVMENKAPDKDKEYCNMIDEECERIMRECMEKAECSLIDKCKRTYFSSDKCGGYNE